MNEEDAASQWAAAVHLLRVWSNGQPAIGWFRPQQLTLYTYDPCRALSERTCWACPLEKCRRLTPE